MNEIVFMLKLSEPSYSADLNFLKMCITFGQSSV